MLRNTASNGSSSLRYSAIISRAEELSSPDYKDSKSFRKLVAIH
jgi:hypothetical protein